jgi:hypothetical protein
MGGDSAVLIAMDQAVIGVGEQSNRGAPIGAKKMVEARGIFL